MIMPTKELTGSFARRDSYNDWQTDYAFDNGGSDTRHTEGLPKSTRAFEHGSKDAGVEDATTDMIKISSPDDVVENEVRDARAPTFTARKRIESKVLQEFVLRIDKILNGNAYITLWGDGSEFCAERPVTEFGDIAVSEGDCLDFRVLIEDNALKQDFKRHPNTEIDPIAYNEFCREVDDIYSE